MLLCLLFGLTGCVVTPASAVQAERPPQEVFDNAKAALHWLARPGGDRGVQGCGGRLTLLRHTVFAGCCLDPPAHPGTRPTPCSQAACLPAPYHVARLPLPLSLQILP